MANYFLYFSTMLDALNKKEEAWAREELKRRSETEDESGTIVESTVDFKADFEVAKEGTSLWIHDNGEYGNVDHVVDFVQSFLKKFRPKESWGFEWANTCSKPRLDAYGGGAAFITATKAVFINTGTWLGKAEAVWKKRKGKRVTPKEPHAK